LTLTAVSAFREAKSRMRKGSHSDDCWRPASDEAVNRQFLA